MMTIDWLKSVFRKRNSKKCAKREVEAQTRELCANYLHACRKIRILKKQIGVEVEKGNEVVAGLLRDELSEEIKKWQKLHRKLKEYVAKTKNQ